MERHPGEVIYEEKPYVHVLSAEHQGKRCDYCFIGAKVNACSACHGPKYCDKKCQRSDWAMHKKECPFFLNVYPDVHSDKERLLLRLILKHMDGDDKLLIGDNDLWKRRFSDLMSHSDIIKDQDQGRSMLFMRILSGLSPSFVARNLQLPDTDILWKLFGKIVINSCCIQDEKRNNLGTGIYLGMSRVNHSCDPNSLHIFNGTTMTIRATEYIKEATPEQVTSSYIDESRPSWERRNELRSRYYFECQCPKCTTNAQEFDRIMTSIKCPSTECDGFFGLKRDRNANSLWPCEKCKNVPTDEEEEIEEYHTFWDESCTYKKKLNELFKKEEYEAARKFAEEKEKLMLKSNFYKTNTNLYALWSISFHTYIRLKLYENAAQCMHKIIEAITHFNPKDNAAIGSALLSLGEIQVYLLNIEEASKSLKKAEKILKITHGPTDYIRQHLEKRQFQCAQYSHWNTERTEIACRLL